MNITSSVRVPWGACSVAPASSCSSLPRPTTVKPRRRPPAGSSADTWVLTLQNGLGVEEHFRERVAPRRIVAGTTTLPSDLVAPGRVRGYLAVRDGA